MATQMTTAQFVGSLADEMTSGEKSASAMLDALTGIITKTVSDGGAVTRPGVGDLTFLWPVNPLGADELS